MAMVSLYGQTELGNSAIRDGEDFSELLNISFAAIHLDIICDIWKGGRNLDEI